MQLRGAGCVGSAVCDWCERGVGGREQQLVELVFETPFEGADALFDVYAQLDEFLGDGFIEGWFVGRVR